MKRQQRIAVVAELVDRLKEHGSWCGETHIQKAVFVLQELLRVFLGYDFVMYRHGPYSFDLRDELSSMRAGGLVKLQARMPPYGPSIITTPEAAVLKERFPKTLGAHRERIAFVARTLGDKGVVELERLATALYVTDKREDGRQSVTERAKKVNKLKPHVELVLAKQAVEDIDRLASEAKNLIEG